MSKLEKMTEQYIVGGEQQEGLIITNDSDAGRDMADSLRNRDKLYSELLSNYIALTRKRNDLKEIHKWVFFWIMNLLVIVSCVCCFVYVFTRKPGDGVVSIIGAFSSLITSLVAIPLIIANYLFNNKEDDNITNVILETEKHDFSELELLKEHFAKSKAEKNDDKNEPAGMRILYQRFSGIPPLESDEVQAELSSLNNKISGLDDPVPDEDES